MNKQKVRDDAKIIRDGLSEEARSAMSIGIAGRVQELAWFKSSQQILVYLSINSEVETQALMHLAREAGKLVFAPRVDERNKTMSFYRVDDKEILKPGPYGVPAPSAVSSRKADMSRPGLIIAPCLAFDRRGGRMGYGAGFYDRFLGGPARGWKRAALAFSVQEVDQVPVESHDSTMQVVVTEKEIIIT